jgi:hypothetical protein
MKKNSWKIHTPHFEYESEYPDFNEPWAGHKNFAYDLVANVQPRRIVELGTYKGTSFFSFCQAVKDFNLHTRLSAIDTWKGDPHAGYYGEDIYEKFIRNKEIFYQGLSVEIFRESFDDAVQHFPDASIDLVHIDGYHTYEAVKHDFQTWLPKVSENGIILLHDIIVKEKDFGVYRLWGEILQDFEHCYTFEHSSGLGVIFLGNSLQYLNMLFHKNTSVKDLYEVLSEKEKWMGLFSIAIKMDKQDDGQPSFLHMDEPKVKADPLSQEALLIKKGIHIQQQNEIIQEQKKKIKYQEHRIQIIKKSVTYRTGQVLIFPLILLSKLFHRIITRINK